MIANSYDFRGGYHTNLPPENTPDNMVLEGQNLYWKGQIKKRPGWTNLSTDATVNGNTVRGFERAFMNSTWYNIVAIDDGSDVNFYYGDDGAYTAIDASFDWTTGVDVEMAVFNNKVIAVNGTDKPAVIYYDSAFIVKTLEAYDARDRTNDEWFAGQWDDGASPEFIDDTTDAQSDTADDFQLANTTNNDGFYIAGVSVFNKIVLTSASQFDGSPVAEYSYYAGDSTWTTFTPTTAPTWTAASGDRTIEFDLPFDSDGLLLWKLYGDVTGQVDPASKSGGALNRFIIRVRFTTAPSSAQTADYMALSHTQYLSQIFLNEKPQAVEVHQDRLFLAAGRAFRYSPPNQVTGWKSREIGSCEDGGLKIVAMQSSDGFLALFKEEAVYRLFGTTTNNFVLRPYPQEGITGPRACAYVDKAIIYVADDGIRGLLGETSVLASRHIQTDFDGWTKSNAVVANYEGNAVISFPTNDTILWVDPDTLRQDDSDAGEGRVSFWEWTGLAADQIVYGGGAGDNGYLILHDMDNNRFVRNTTNGYDVAFDTTETAITTTLQTKYSSFGVPGNLKINRRVKVEVSKSGDYTLTMYANNGDSNATATIASGIGTGHYTADISIPYTLDKYNLSYKLVNATVNAVSIYGFATDVDRRTF